MSLEQTLSRLARGLSDGTLKRLNSATVVKGRLVDDFDTPVAVKFFTVPDGGNPRNVNAEDGAQEINNRHFYFQGAGFDVGNRDIINFEGQDFEVREPESRLHGGFTYVRGKAIPAKVPR